MKKVIVHITDLHVDAESSFLAGIQPMDRLKTVLDDVAIVQPDALWITGDLTNDTPQDAKLFAEIKALLPDLPTIVLAGNHDDPCLVAATFHPEWLQGKLCYGPSEIAGRPLFCLDSSRGRLTEDQWVWLDFQAQSTPGLSPIVLMHHPPVYASGGFMDNNYPFIEQDRFVAWAAHWTHVDVFCGHYHHGIDIRHANVHVHVAPSTLFQVSLHGEGFTPITSRYGYQLVTLSEDHHISVERRYL